MSDLMSEKLDYTQLIDFDEHELSQTGLTLIQSCDFDYTFSETSDPLKTCSEKVQTDFVNSTHTTTSQKPENTSDTGSVNWKKIYYNNIKPLCVDLENSYGELFYSTKVNEPDFVKAFVAKRVAKALEKVKKSLSCSSLINFDTTFNKSFGNNYIDGASSTFNTVNSNANTSKIVSKMNHAPFFSGSIEVLNHSHCLDEEIANLEPGNTTFEVQPLQSTNKLKKSLSFSGFSGTTKNDSLFDIELQLEDSIPSEDEKDELGLPGKKFFSSGTPSKKADISRTLKKYKKILRASFSGDQCEDSNVNDNLRESKGAPVITTKAEAVFEPPLLSEIQDHVEIHLKKDSNKVSAKGPMKALVPLQNMTKQKDIKIMSPSKKKKEKTIDVSTKSSSHVLGESFDNESPPIASSTPTSGGRSNRSSSANNSVHASRRSMSEGRTPTKNNKETTQKFLHTGIATNKQGKPLINNLKILNSIDPSTAKVNGKGSKQLVHPKPNVSNIGVRRPSTAPVNIKAPLTTKIFPVNRTSTSRIKSLSNVSTAVTKSNNTSKLSANSTCTLQRADNKETNTTKLGQKLQYKNTKEESRTSLSKLRRTTSHIGKENK